MRAGGRRPRGQLRGRRVPDRRARQLLDAHAGGRVLPALPAGEHVRHVHDGLPRRAVRDGRLLPPRPGRRARLLRELRRLPRAPRPLLLRLLALLAGGRVPRVERVPARLHERQVRQVLRREQAAARGRDQERRVLVARPGDGEALLPRARRVHRVPAEHGLHDRPRLRGRGAVRRGRLPPQGAARRDRRARHRRRLPPGPLGLRGHGDPLARGAPRLLPQARGRQPRLPRHLPAGVLAQPQLREVVARRRARAARARGRRRRRRGNRVCRRTFEARSSALESGSLLRLVPRETGRASLFPRSPDVWDRPLSPHPFPDRPSRRPRRSTRSTRSSGSTTTL